MPPPDAPPGPGDFLELFWAPTDVFRRRRDAGFGLPLLVLTVLFVALYYLTLPAAQAVWDAEFAKGMQQALADNPQLKPEQLDAMKGVQQKFAGAIFAVSVPLIALCLGLTVWLAGSLVGAKQTFTQAANLATLAYFPRLLEFLANAVQGVLLDDAAIAGVESVNLGVARLLPAGSDAALLAFCGRIDLFTLWVTALIALGLVAMTKGRVRAPQAWLAAGLVWFVGALPRVLPPLLRGME
ncbi:MAG: YIP1 family protein [Gemmatimonadales bacterium]|nr:YIP1 family protein [Gemmatimonadales bacterium]